MAVRHALVLTIVRVDRISDSVCHLTVPQASIRPEIQGHTIDVHGLEVSTLSNPSKSRSAQDEILTANRSRPNPNSKRDKNYPPIKRK